MSITNRLISTQLITIEISSSMAEKEKNGCVVFDLHTGKQELIKHACTTSPSFTNSLVE